MNEKLTTGDKFEAIKRFPPVFRKEIFDASVIIQAAKVRGLLSNPNIGIADSEWADSFDMAFEMYMKIVEEGPR